MKSTNLHCVFLFSSTASVIGLLLSLSPAWSLPPSNPRDVVKDPLPKEAILRLGTNQMRSDSPLADIVFSQKTPYAVSICDSRILLWSTTSGRILASSNIPRVAKSSNSPFSTSPYSDMLAISGNGKYFVLNCQGHLFRYPIPFNGEPEEWSSKPVNQSFVNFVVDNAGECLYGFNRQGEFVQWKRGADNWKILESNRSAPSKRMVAIGGDVVAYSCGSRSVCFYDPQKRSNPAIELQAPLSSLSISGNGKILATACVEIRPKIKISTQIWDVQVRKEIASSPILSNLLSLNESGDTLATSRLSDGMDVDIYSTSTMTKIRTITNPPDRLKLFQINDKGTVLVTAGQQGVVNVIEISSGQRLFSGEGHIAPVSAVVATRAANFITSALDGSIILWDKTGKVTRRFTEYGKRSIRSIALSGDESTLYSGGSDRVVRAWDVATGRELRSYTLEVANAVYSLAISPDSRHIAVGAVDQVILLDASTLKPTHPPMICGDGPIDPVSFSSNDRLFTRNLKSEIKCWSVESGRLLYAIDTKSQQLGRSPLAATLDGEKMLSSFSPSDFLAKKSLYLATWSPATGKLLDKFDLDFPLSVITVDPSGKKVAVGSQSGDIVIFHFDAKLPKTTLKGHRGRVSALSFSPDGQFLISGSDDTTAVVWSMTNNH